MLSWSILQYFWPALSDNWSWNPVVGLLFEWPLKTGLTVFYTIKNQKDLHLTCVWIKVGLTLHFLLIFRHNKESSNCDHPGHPQLLFAGAACLSCWVEVFSNAYILTIIYQKAFMFRTSLPGMVFCDFIRLELCVHASGKTKDTFIHKMLFCWVKNMSQCMRFPTMWYVRPAKLVISLRTRAVWSEPLLVAMIVKLLTEQHLELLSLKEGCGGSSESTLVKMSNCWKSHAAAHMW